MPHAATDSADTTDTLRRVGIDALFAPVRVRQVLPDECVRCSVASLFGLSREEVPHFFAENAGRWHVGLEEWLAQRGMKYELWHASLIPPDEWYLG